MSPKLKQYGVLIIAAVLLIAMAFTGVASADPIEITTAEELASNLSQDPSSVSGNTVVLQHNVLNVPNEFIINSTAGIVLDLNGYVINMSGHRFATVDTNAKFTLSDSNISQPKHYFSVDSDTGLWIWNNDTEPTAFNVTGGVITGGNETDASAGGGGVCVNGHGTFSMTGGSIVGCMANSSSINSFAGGVYVNFDGEFTMSGGSITGCTAVNDYYSNGGGVVNYGTFTMTDGSIANCTAAGGREGIGGGIYNGGLFTMSGGNITGCTASGADIAQGGGVLNLITFNMTGGFITGCTVLSNKDAQGGGVLNKGAFKMTDGTITKCAALGDNITRGGGVLTYDAFTMSGGKIAGCTADQGSGVYLFYGAEGSWFSREVYQGKLIINGTACVDANNDAYLMLYHDDFHYPYTTKFTEITLSTGGLSGTHAGVYNITLGGDDVYEWKDCLLVNSSGTSTASLDQFKLSSAMIEAGFTLVQAGKNIQLYLLPVEIGSAAAWNTFASDYRNYGKNISITNDLDFSKTAIHPLNLTNDNYEGYKGNIEGNNHVISGFIINATEYTSGGGLIGTYSGTDGYIKNLTLRNFSISGVDALGGLIGIVTNSVSLHIENINISDGNVTGGGGSIGGLIGTAYDDAVVWINASSVKDMYIYGTESVGGILGSSKGGTYTHIIDSQVIASEIRTDDWRIGGLIGYDQDSAWSVTSFKHARVKDCIIYDLGVSVGGLVGDSGKTTRIDGCAVENCTIEPSSTSWGRGGLLGSSTSNQLYFTGSNMTWVNYTWVNGTDDIGSLIGRFDVSTISELNPAPQHFYVNSSGYPNNSTVEGIDNSFDDTAGIELGSVLVRQHLIAGEDYGFRNRHTVTVSAEHGSAAVKDQKTTFIKGDTVNLTYKADSGYTFKEWISEPEVVVTDNMFTMPSANVTITAVFEKQETPYTPSHKESGSTVIQQQAQDISKDPTPANQQTADVSVKYVAQTVIGTSTADTAALKQQYPEAAARVELALSTAEAAGVKLTNSKGAKAVIVTTENIPDIEKVTFSRVYEISPANEGEKLTKVTVKVPKSDITAKGLTSEDVTIYHFLETYNLWVPLDTLSVSQDDSNYYYTAATDGTSPFGVLVKKIGDDSTAVPTTQSTQSSPAPFLGIIAGLGAAAVLMRMRQ